MIIVLLVNIFKNVFIALRNLIFNNKKTRTITCLFNIFFILLIIAVILIIILCRYQGLLYYFYKIYHIHYSYSGEKYRKM